MSIPVTPAPVVYPESDGKPMADNTIQFRWIQTLSSNLFILFRERQDVFVGGNLFWYPVENFPDIVQAPDVFVVFNRPPGDRSSYRQWEEDHVPMTVVFEIRSPNDSDALMREKFEFYDEHGVEEYYAYDPETNELQVYLRRGGNLGPQRVPGGSFLSPRLGVRFQVTEPEMLVYHPTGERFLTSVEFVQETEAARQESDLLRREREVAQQQAEIAQREREAAQQQAEIAQREREAAQQQAEIAQREREAAQQQAEIAQREREAAQQQAEIAQREREAAQQRVARLSELTRKALRGQATPDEQAELERLLAG